jgi:hypothetical protein
VHSINELLTKYNTTQADDIVLVSSLPSQNFKRQITNFSKYKNRKLMSIPAGISIIAVSLLSIWYFIYLPSTLPLVFDKKWLVLSSHAGWNASIASNNNELKSGSWATYQIRNEIIDKQQKDVLTLTAYLTEGPYWVTAHFVTNETIIIHMLREGSGVRFKVLGDSGSGWTLVFWTVHEEHISYDFPIYTIDNQTVEINIPFSSLRQPVYQRQIPFDKKNISHMAILRHSPDFSLISGSSTIKIFDFEIY